MKYYLPTRISIEVQFGGAGETYEDRAEHSYAVMGIELKGADGEDMAIVPNIKVPVGYAKGEREMGMVRCLEQVPRIITAWIVNATLEQEAPKKKRARKAALV